MDKYTVDLDQVLNDFEYSELRDEHTTLTIQNNIQSNSLRNNFKNTNAKHSINNVFHSLNEYLGTEITPKQNNQDREKSNNCGANSATSKQCDNVEGQQTFECAQVEEGTFAIAQHVKPEIIEEKLNEVQHEENALDSVETTENESGNNEKSEGIVEDLLQIDTEPETIISDEESNGNLNETLVKEEELQIQPEHQSEQIIEETNESDDLKQSEVLSIQPEPPIKPEEQTIPIEEVKPVASFDTDVELDETELSKYLDDLEEEFGECSKDNGDESQPPPIVSRPTDLSLTSKESEEGVNVINLVGDPGSTPFNNVYVDKELAGGATSPTPSELSSDTTSSYTPSTDTVADDPPPAVAPVQESVPETNANEVTESQPQQSGGSWLGRQAPIWIPDCEANSCLHCDQKFTVIKRRHHCRACGYVLCSRCCSLRMKLDYLSGEMARVCNRCHDVLSNNDATTLPRQPNPSNPSEYCSTVSPLQQSGDAAAVAPSVMVPVGVLKRKGSNKGKSTKSVMFCDGIRPGSDLTNLDGNSQGQAAGKTNQNKPVVVAETESFIPAKGDELPPLVDENRTFGDCKNDKSLMEELKGSEKVFALHNNLTVRVRIVELDCCINKTVWCFCTEGLIYVGQDEIVILLEFDAEEETLPKDVLLHLNRIYLDAVKGSSVKEMGLSLHQESNFLSSKNHAGFVYIKPSFQCLQKIIQPAEPYLIGILIHRWETPWAKLFPLRLVLRLGAEYRYYPSPIISTRNRDSVFVEVGHTIINLLADFRNFSYTLPQIRGLTIHMEDKNTTVTIPANRYDQVMKSLSNSSDYILAFAGNFSNQADSHLVCIQNTQSNDSEYTSHAINIHNKPRKVTGASFIVFNGALKSSSGLTAKSSIVEDGLMIQIPPDDMSEIREALRNMKDYKIQCGCVNAASDETVSVIWGEADSNFNINVLSPIDNKSMEGIPSIRVHNGKDYTNGSRMIRWTEVFIIQNENETKSNQEPLDISKLSETISKAACTALVKYLDLLASNNCFKIAIRTNLNTFPASYSAGSNGTKLPPIYMESLDNELIPVLHRNSANTENDEHVIVLELIFRLLNK